MGGSPRGKDKPRPSYEDGKLRDPAVEAEQRPLDRDAVRRLIGKAVKRPT